MSRIGHVKAFSSAAIRRRKEVRTPKRPGTAAGNPRAISHERLAVQERRRRLSAHTGAGGGGDLAGKRKRCTPGTAASVHCDGAPPGAPFAYQDARAAYWSRNVATPLRTAISTPSQP